MGRTQRRSKACSKAEALIIAQGTVIAIAASVVDVIRPLTTPLVIDCNFPAVLIDPEVGLVAKRFLHPDISGGIFHVHMLTDLTKSVD